MADYLEFTTLGSVVARTGGALQTGPFGSQLHASDYQPTGIPLIMPVNLGDNEVHEKGIARIGATDAYKLRRHALRDGDIVFSRRGDVGRRSLIRETETGWLCGTGCLAARFGPRTEHVNPAYVAEYLGSNAAQTWLVDNAVGGTMPNLNTSILAALPLLLLPKREQDRIVVALGDVQETIRTFERLIAKKQAIKQGMMQQLLTGRTRLPEFTGPWQELRLGDVLTVRHGKNQRAVEVSSGQYPILATGGQIGWANTPLYNKPSVLIGRKGTIDRPQFQDQPFWTVDTLFYTEISPVADPRFLYYVFLTIDWRSMNEASGVPSLSSNRIENVAVKIPQFNEQVAIRQVLDDADQEIDVLRQRLSKARNVKSGMVQQLLTGRTRLPAEVES